jgi:putative aminopeptidase FrvX
MDEIAMTVRAVREDGTLGVGPSGGFLPRKFGEGPVTILGDLANITGVFSMGSGHAAADSSGASPWEPVCVHTGLSRRQLADAGVRQGSPMVPVRERRGPVFLGGGDDPLVACWTFDDRMGIVSLLRLLQECRERSIQPRRDTIIAFTVHEEGGCHGAKFVANRERPDVFIAVDGSPASGDNGLLLDGRPGIWSQDKLANYSQDLVTDFCRLARDAGEELQVAVFPGAASDASHVYAAGGAGRIATVGHVRENSHGFEVARLSCFDRLLNVLLRCFEAWPA